MIEHTTVREGVEQDPAEHFGILALHFRDLVGYRLWKSNSQIDGTLLPHRPGLTRWNRILNYCETPSRAVAAASRATLQAQAAPKIKA